MTGIMEGVEAVREGGRYHVLFDGGFDCVSSAPGGGFLKGIARITFGDYEDCDISLPCGSADSVRTCYQEIGETRVFAAAYSDLRDGLGCASEACVPGGGMTHVLVVLGCNTPESGMLRTTVTATEAVTAAVQDLLLRSDGGSRSATGSVHQTVTVVRSSDSPLLLHGAGKHSKLGQMIGSAVYAAVSESAAANGVSFDDSADASVLLGRHGYGPEELFRMSGCTDREAFDLSLAGVSRDQDAAAAVSAALFLSDEIAWGLVPEADGLGVVHSLLSSVLGYDGGSRDPVLDTAAALVGAACRRM